MTSSPAAARRAGSTATGATLGRRRSARGDAAGAARRAQHRLQALGLRAVRLGGRLAHGAPARVRRRRGPAAARGRATRSRSRSTATAGGSPATPTRDGRGGARVRPEPRLRRRRAARPDQLPQLRQPGEAGRRPGSSTARSAASPTACEALGVPVVGGNVSLYNEGPDGPIYPTPVVGMVGELPDPARVGRLRLRRARATRSACSAPSRRPWPARSWPSSAASSTPACPSPTIAAVAAACATVREAVRGGRAQPPPTTSATAASPARWPSARSAPSSAAGPTSSRCASAAAHPRRRSSARAPAASCSAASGRSWKPSGAIVIGEVGGDEIEIAAGEVSLQITLPEARAAWNSLAERLEVQA